MGSKHTNVLELMGRIDTEGALGRLSIAEAVALIASRVGDQGDSRLVRNRIRMQLKRSHDNGDDVMAGGLACGTDHRYTVDEIASWAQQRYPGIFDDLPRVGRNVSNTFIESVRFSDRSGEEVTPGNLGDCQAELRKTRALLKRALWELQVVKVDYERRLSLYGNFFQRLP